MLICQYYEQAIKKLVDSARGFCTTYAFADFLDQVLLGRVCRLSVNLSMKTISKSDTINYRVKITKDFRSEIHSSVSFAQCLILTFQYVMFKSSFKILLIRYFDTSVGGLE